VARRWRRLFPKRNDGNGQAAEPEEHELQMLMADEQTLAERLASNKGFLPLQLEQYLELLHRTGWQARQDKRGQIPAELLPILRRLRLSPETWVETVLNFGRWFRLAAGRVVWLPIPW